jgi:hypothetical protein
LCTSKTYKGLLITFTAPGLCFIRTGMSFPAL